MKKEEQVALTLTASQRDDMVKRLGYLRCWHQGFEAAGGKPAHEVDTLRRVQLALKDAK